MRVRDMSQMILRVNPEVKEWLEKKAKSEERSQNWLIGKILEEAMQNDRAAKQE